MSQIDTDENVLSETTAEQGDGLKLVPVAESIRYRRRAQSAEKKIETLAEQLADARSRVSDMSGQLDRVRTEQKLTGKLVVAGAVDLEAAVLLASSRMEGADDSDLDGVIEQLKKDKSYLFGDNVGTVVAGKTAGVKERMVSGQKVLERAATKAATTGNRADLQEYLKLRRNFV